MPCRSLGKTNTFNYASTANAEEVMKLYNLGDKTFETDFRILCHRKHEIVQIGLNYGRMITIDIKVCRKQKCVKYF